MTDQTPAPAPKPKKRRRAVRRRPAAIAATPKPAEDFPGLTVAACTAACGPQGCAISGNTYCAHPRKGGLQPVDMCKPDAIGRLKKAKLQLEQQELDAKAAATT